MKCRTCKRPPNPIRDLKKQRLKEAKSQFPYKVKLERASLEDIKKRIIENRLRSWKEVGDRADYFQEGRNYYFKDEAMAAFLGLILI